MTTVVTPGSPAVLSLNTGEIVTVSAADGASAGRIGQLADQVGGAMPDVPQSAYRVLSAGGSLMLGPYARPTRHLIEARAGTLTYPTPSARIAAPAISGTPTDVIEMFGTDAPTDNVTGLSTAGPGSRYTDISGANLYICTGSKAAPAWKPVTRAA